MKLELEFEETQELLSLLVDRICQESELPDEERAALKRWRSQDMRGTSDSMRELTEKVNADLVRLLQSKQKSSVRKHDWT